MRATAFSSIAAPVLVVLFHYGEAVPLLLRHWVVLFHYTRNIYWSCFTTPEETAENRGILPHPSRPATAGQRIAPGKLPLQGRKTQAAAEPHRQSDAASSPTSDSTYRNPAPSRAAGPCLQGRFVTLRDFPAPEAVTQRNMIPAPAGPHDAASRRVPLRDSPMARAIRRGAELSIPRGNRLPSAPPQHREPNA